jgi:tight adherence protein B
MIIISLLLAALATALVIRRPAGVALAARLDPADDGDGKRRQLRLSWWLAVPPAVAGGVVALAVVVGPSPAAVGLAVAIAAASAVRLAQAAHRRRRSLAARRAVTEACAVLASQLRIGRVPSDALAVAAQDCPVLDRARSAAQLGGDVVSVWQVQSTAAGCGGLADLARAWRVSSETGAPMAAALERVATNLGDDQSLAATVAAELAGPRATGKIMAVLPVCGLALGYALGGDPVRFLLTGALGWGCLVGGVALAALGVLWVERLARHAAGDR